MNDDEFARRRKLTFAQAEGAELLPTQLKRTEVSPQLRAVLWNYVYEELRETDVTVTVHLIHRSTIALLLGAAGLERQLSALSP